MKGIRIIACPPGFAPERIRKAWIGVTIVLADQEHPQEDPEEGKKQLRTGTENLGGYQVRAGDAIEALRSAGKVQASGFWDQLLGADSPLIFRADVCELVDMPS